MANEQQMVHRSSSWFRLGSWRRECVLRLAKAARISCITVVLALASCLGSQQRASWKVFPLQRRTPHDGLAVVSQPDGFGLHLFLETNSDDPAVCTPRWFPDAARLFNGNGTAPFSAGLAPREEFFAAVLRRDVRRALRKELKALCQQRAPEARWQWTPPPTDASELTPVRLPAYEERDLLIDPKEEKQREKNLLRDDQKPSQTTGSASRQ